MKSRSKKESPSLVRFFVIEILEYIKSSQMVPLYIAFSFSFFFLLAPFIPSLNHYVFSSLFSLLHVRGGSIKLSGSSAVAFYVAMSFIFYFFGCVYRLVFQKKYKPVSLIRKVVWYDGIILGMYIIFLFLSLIFSPKDQISLTAFLFFLFLSMTGVTYSLTVASVITKLIFTLSKKS